MNKEIKLTINDQKALKFINSFDDSYVEDVKDFTKFLVLSGKELTADSIIEYLSYVEDPTQYPEIPSPTLRYSAETYNKRLKAIKNRVRKLIKSSDYRADIETKRNMEDFLKELKYKKINSVAISPEDIPTNEEMKAVIAEASPRLRLIMLALNDTGLRISELLGITLSDITEKKSTVTLRIHGKGGKERQVYIDPKLYRTIRSTFGSETQVYLFEKSSGRPYNRNGVTNMIRTLSKATVGKCFSAHDIRHRFTTDLIEEFGLSSASKYIGHANVNTTSRIYDHTTINAHKLQNFRRNRG